jgi:hypothetical protein
VTDDTHVIVNVPFYYAHGGLGYAVNVDPLIDVPLGSRGGGVHVVMRHSTTPFET